MIERGPYTLNLVAVDNSVGFVADVTSTLEVMVDDINNGTNITCLITGDQEHMLIYKESEPVIISNNNNVKRVNSILFTECKMRGSKPQWGKMKFSHNDEACKIPLLQNILFHSTIYIYMYIYICAYPHLKGLTCSK